MTDTPKKIWRWAVQNCGGFIEYSDFPVISKHSTEYTRTDISQARLAKAMVVLKLISGADWEARLGEAIDISCEILAENMGDEE